MRRKGWRHDDRWVTIGRKGEDGKHHGVHVLIDDDGKVVTGPEEWVGHSVGELPKKEKVKASHKLRHKMKLSDKEKKAFEAVDAENIVHKDPDSMELYKLIKSGKYLKRKYLKEHPTVKKLESLAKEWESKLDEASTDTSEKRQAVRDKVYNGFMRQGSYSGKTREKGIEKDSFKGKIDKGNKAYIVIGFPASGKSTKIANPLSQQEHAFIIDSDMLRERFPEYKKSKGAASSALSEEASALRHKALAEFTKGSRRGENVILPIIGGSVEACESFRKELERAGYDVEFKLQAADRRSAANRIVMRAIETGRIVPLRSVMNESCDPEATFEHYKALTNERGLPYVREKG